MPTSTFTQQPARRRGLTFYRKLLFLYALNLSDWLCTEALLSTGKFHEANPLMVPVLPHFLPTLLLKGVLPLALTLLCALLFRLAEAEETRFVRLLLNFGIIAYTLVNLWHIISFVVLFSGT